MFTATTRQRSAGRRPATLAHQRIQVRMKRLTTRSSEDWPNRSVSWTLELEDLGGQITAWEDGTAELDLVDMARGGSRSEHRQLGDLEDIRGAIDSISAWVVGRSRLADN